MKRRDLILGMGLNPDNIILPDWKIFHLKNRKKKKNIYIYRERERDYIQKKNYPPYINADY